MEGYNVVFFWYNFIKKIFFLRLICNYNKCLRDKLLICLVALKIFSGVFNDKFIMINIASLLEPNVKDYFYTYEKKSGRVSDDNNGFNLTGNTRIHIMNPCINCSIELTPIVCDSLNLTLKTFSVNIMNGKFFLFFLLLSFSCLYFLLLFFFVCLFFHSLFDDLILSQVTDTITVSPILNLFYT